MTEKELPDKCDLCGLKQTFPSDTKNLFPSLRLLFDKGIIKHKFPRNLHVCVGCDEEDREDFCLISHPSWSSNEKKCESWQLEIGLQKSDYLAINSASEATKSAKETVRLTNNIYYLTVAIVVYTLIQVGMLLTPYV